MSSVFRRVGISDLEPVPWGEHLCVFYPNRTALLDLAVSFVKAGLEDNEFCMWITGDTITPLDAFNALDTALPDAHRYLAARQLEILPHHQWYLSNGMFVADVVLSNWVSKAEHARLKGFAGIRITGNPFWLRSHDERESFGRYERQVSERIKHQRILALCTYPMSTHTPSEMIDVMHLHSSALMPRMGAWRRVIASSLPRDRRGVAGPKSE